MKVLIVSLMCVVARVCGSAVAWPGAVALASPGYSFRYTPAHSKGFAYSSTQYINALPSTYSFGVYPQIPQYGYQIPQATFAPAQQSYYPAPGAAYFPGSIYYPSASPITTFIPGSSIQPISGVSLQPGQPPQTPSNPENSFSDPQSQPGNTDSTVIDSADSTPQQEPANQAVSQIPSTFPSSFPGFPQIPQDFPPFPQFPQGSEGAPSFPQIPQLPQQPQIPGFPGFPQSPINSPSQNPSPAPPSSFPATGSQDQGISDEDTISVESA